MTVFRMGDRFFRGNLHDSLLVVERGEGQRHQRDETHHGEQQHDLGEGQGRGQQQPDENAGGLEGGGVRPQVAGQLARRRGLPWGRPHRARTTGFVTPPAARPAQAVLG